jgi:hypothetical protein
MHVWFGPIQAEKLSKDEAHAGKPKNDWNNLCGIGFPE